MSDPEHESAARAPAAPSAILVPRVGWVAGTTPGGELLIDFEGNAAGPIPARSTVAIDAASAREAAAARAEAVLLFDGGDPARPLVIGLVKPTSTPMIDLVLEPTEEAEALDPALDATVDGRRVVIEGQDEIVLRCGKASITLRRNGKIVIRGAYVETHAAGTNRIKGGSVRIN